MICPGCAAEMTAMTLDGHVGGTKVAIDMCPACHAFWFDRFENLQLAPRSIVRLFQLMTEQGSASRPFTRALGCPRCLSPLRLTHDIQHTTSFEYWRCEQEHGRFITFLNFLREKDFIRPLTPEQIAELRDSVQTVNCSNCGGPIDLARGSVCPHCGSPLTIVDMKRMQEVLAHYRQADAPRAVDPALPLLLERAKRQTEEQFARLGSGSGSPSLVEAGLRAVLLWLQNTK
jgi:Zn-finger nucleic acid-binding protein